tara:strand:+ start:146 stop:1150 length:1005 start_codon:yes stop_codon:yes gene_type:complete
MKLFLSHAGLGEVKGGVELYAKYLSNVFSDIKTVDYHSFQEKIGDTSLFPFKEPIRAKKLGEYVSEKYPDAETIFSNGMFCWNLKEKKQINICHGTYAAFAEKAYSKTNPDYYRLSFLYNYFEKKAAKNASLVISNSKSTALNVKKFFGLDSTVIYPPVDLENFKETKKPVAREKLNWRGPTVLFVGRPERQKGFDIVESLAEKHSTINFKCILSRPYNSKLKNLEVIEPQKHSDLALYYSAADLVINPSRFEGFGFVTVESLACNQKTLVMNTGIAPEIKNQNLFVANNEKQFEELFNEALIAKSTESRSLVEEKFSLQEFRKNWQKALKSYD